MTEAPAHDEPSAGVDDGTEAPPRPKHAPLSDPADLAAAVEAILFVVETPVTAASVAAAIQQPEPAVAAAIETLRASYDERGAGVEVRDVGGGVRIYTRPAVAAQVEIFLQDGQRSRLTQAALETLAVVAYRQPVTKAEIEAIRGVQAGPILRTLIERGLVRVTGRADVPGHPLQYGTTREFLDRFGLASLADLPRDGELTRD